MLRVSAGKERRLWLQMLGNGVKIEIAVADAQSLVAHGLSPRGRVGGRPLTCVSKLNFS